MKRREEEKTKEEQRKLEIRRNRHTRQVTPLPVFGDGTIESAQPAMMTYLLCRPPFVRRDLRYFGPQVPTPRPLTGAL